jgi:hypothetical protein
MRGYFDNSDLVKFLQSPIVGIPYYTQNNAIAAVTPAYLLHEILYSEPLVKMGEEITGSLFRVRPEPGPIAPAEPAK